MGSLFGRTNPDFRLFNAVWILALLAGAGYVAALLLGHNSSRVHRTTRAADASARIERVTVTGPARTVTRRVPVVRRVHGRRVVEYLTRTVRLPGTTRVLTHRVVRYRRLVVNKVVTRNGRTTTERVVRTVPVKQTQTQTQTETQTQVQTSTVTQRSTVTQPVTETIVSTVTQTQTLPVTVTTPVTVTVTTTATAPPSPTTTG
jgi:hypothetical protein